MDLGIKDKRALVTGSTAGIGFAAGEALARGGAQVIVTTPDEVASLIAYVASERASGTTGAALRVDGGVIRAIA